MITAPSQGFRTGLDIQFIATPYPLPKTAADELINSN